MNQIKMWFAENKGPAVLAGLFLILAGLGAWFAYASWEDYSLATENYSAAAAKLATLTKQSPPPSGNNLDKLDKTIDAEQNSLNELLGTLRRYVIPAFASLEKAKPQDAPQLLQDALRAQVTKLKGMANTSGATLPSGFYLGLEEYENRLPSPDDSIALAKQLTAFNWISELLVAHPGLIVAEFSRIVPTQAQTLKSDRKPAPQNSAPKAELPYENPASLKISLRCDQGSLREILNALSQAPYFLVIDSLQLQNTVTEPPRRDSAGQQPPPQPVAGGTLEGQTASQRIPIILGRELINASFRIRILEFPDRQQNPPKSTK
jgi:hypothetical protein